MFEIKVSSAGNLPLRYQAVTNRSKPVTRVNNSTLIKYSPNAWGGSGCMTRGRPLYKMLAARKTPIAQVTHGESHGAMSKMRIRKTGLRPYAATVNACLRLCRP